MAVKHVYPSGDSLILVGEDGKKTTALPTGGGAWLVKKVDGGTDPDPEPGEGGWQHPLGKSFPTGTWTTYEDGGGSHSGGAVDIGLGSGTEAPLYSACDGKVIFAGWEDNYGGNVVIVQPNGESSGVTYAHMNRIDVNVGDVVKGGKQVGLSGWTGLVIPPGPAGAHLHVEVRTNGTQWGPWHRAAPYFASKGVTL